MLSTGHWSQLAEVEAEILKLETNLIALRRRRNSLMPLLDLPSKIITKVLFEIMDNSISQEKNNPSQDYDFTWLSATHFCSHWRTIALGCSALWTHLTFSYPQLFKSFLQRSRDELLDICTSANHAISAEDCDDMFQLIVDNMHRTRSLNIRGNDLEDRILWLRGISAPNLEILKLSGYTSEPIHIPPNSVELNVMPKLQKLELKSCTQDLQHSLLSLHLPSVTSLTIFDVSLADQLDILARCSSIRHLSIESGVIGLLNGLPSVDLPQLEYMRFHHDNWSLFDLITIPSIQQMDIKLEINRDDLGSTNRAIMRFTQCLDLTYKNAHPHHFALTYDGTKIVVSTQSQAGNDIVTLTVHDYDFGWDIDPSRYAHFFDSLLQLAQLRGIGFQSLDIDDKRGDFTRSTRPIFNSFQHQSSISTLGFRGMLQLYDFLLIDEADNPGCVSEERQPVCTCQYCHNMRVSAFPGLKTLILDHVTKSAQDVLLNNGVDSYYWWLRELPRWLEERNKRGVGVETLVLRFEQTEVEGEKLKLDELRRNVTNLVIEML